MHCALFSANECDYELLANKDIHFPTTRQEYSISEQDFDDQGLLGSGSSGNVAKMRHKPTGRVIAVKVNVNDCRN